MRLIILTFCLLSAPSLSLAIILKEPINLITQRRFPPPISSYDQLLQNIKKERTNLKKSGASLDSTRKYFLNQFEHEIFPHWVGTTWDYNGYTNRPGEGKLIACGYFVSTPLKHMGFNWNRFKLAQMYSKAIVDTLCSDMTTYSDLNEMVHELEGRDDHLYIVGLDNHVGMLLKRRNALWFVHSNYIGIEGPVEEYALESEALSYSSNYWVGTFTSDENMKKWLDGTEFPTE